MNQTFHSTTIVGVKRNGKIVLAGDGQVTMGESVVFKNKAVKVRRVYDSKIVIGFAGSAADSFALSGKFEEMLHKYSGNLMRAAVELATLWRTDKMLRQLNAMMIVADKEQMLLLSGTGDVIEPDEDVIAIGSGGNFALAAARAMMKKTKLTAKEIATEAIMIAGEICCFTNQNITIEEV